MLTSVLGLPRMGMRKFALPMLSAILLSLSGHPSPARAPGAPATQLAPGQVTEAITRAATVISTAHYQANLGLSCTDHYCEGHFPRPGAGHRLNVTRLSCVMTSNAEFRLAAMQLVKADGTPLMTLYLPGDYSSPGNFHTLNQAVDLQVLSKRRIKVHLQSEGGTANAGICTLTGTLETLG